MTDLTLFRGTTEPWEIAIIEARLPETSLISGKYMEQAEKIIKNFETGIRTKIRTIQCSQLRSGKEIVMGKIPVPLTLLTAQEINAEIVARVGVETMLGTPNYYSHFIPCGTCDGISSNFGHGEYYRFHIQGTIYGRSMDEIRRYVNERQNLPDYIVPLFKGGNNEVLAYTGSLITSVELMTGPMNVKYTVFNSLD